MYKTAQSLDKIRKAFSGSLCEIVVKSPYLYSIYIQMVHQYKTLHEKLEFGKNSWESFLVRMYNTRFDFDFCIVAN